jgi:hypothetical protein
LLRNCSFDDLLEEFVKLELRSLNGPLPDPLPLEGTLSIERNETRAVVIARRGARDWQRLGGELQCRIELRPLALEEIYPLVLREGARP